MSELAEMRERMNGNTSYPDTYALAAQDRRKLFDRIRSLEAANAKLEQDARRYQWLRQWAGRAQDFPDDVPDATSPESLDAAIDSQLGDGK